MIDATSKRCWLYTADGQLLSPGSAALTAGPPQPESIIAFWADRPARVIKDCLLGRLQDVRLQLDDGTIIRASVEQVFFQPPYGRCCRLRIVSVVCPSTVIMEPEATLPIEALPHPVPVVAV